MWTSKTSQSLHAKETGESLEDTVEARLMWWALHSIRDEAGVHILVWVWVEGSLERREIFQSEHRDRCTTPDCLKDIMPGLIRDGCKSSVAREHSLFSSLQLEQALRSGQLRMGDEAFGLWVG